MVSAQEENESVLRMLKWPESEYEMPIISFGAIFVLDGRLKSAIRLIVSSSPIAIASKQAEPSTSNINRTTIPSDGRVQCVIKGLVLFWEKKLFKRTCFGLRDCSVLLNAKSTSVRLTSPFGDIRTSLSGFCFGR